MKTSSNERNHLLQIGADQMRLVKLSLKTHSYYCYYLNYNVNTKIFAYAYKKLVDYSNIRNFDDYSNIVELVGCVTFYKEYWKLSKFSEKIYV